MTVAAKALREDLKRMLRVCQDSRYFVAVEQQQQRGDRGSELRITEQLDLGKRLMANVRRKWASEKMGINLNELKLNEAHTSVLELTGKIKRCADIEAHVTGKKALIAISEEYSCRPKIAEIDDEQHTKENRVPVRVDQSCRLSTTVFTTLAMKNECFVNAQRQRKIWWMKLFANPGRLYASEICSRANVQRSSLWSKYPFGDIEIERFECISTTDPDQMINQLPVAIRSTICLESASFGTLLDAIDESVETEICLNRTIAPYQCSVLAMSTSHDARLNQDLMHLTKYVHLLAERSGISMLKFDSVLAPDEAQLTVNLNRMDAIGMPYVLIVHENSLDEGMLKLRNRDTSLSETIHLSDVPVYLPQIFDIAR